MSSTTSAPIRRWTSRHRLAAFLGLTFVLTWWAWPLWALGAAISPHWPWGPLLAALVVIGIAEGAPGYRALGARMIRWRVGWTWWLVAIGTPLAVLAVAAFANVAFWGAPAPQLGAVAWSSLLLVAAVRFVDPLDGPLGEEPGWRGYALPLLQIGRSPLRAAALLGVVAALWHLPLVTAGRLAAVGLPITFVITFVYVWLFDHTRGSVLLTMVFHVMQGTVGYAALGFGGADAARMDLLTGALWTLLAGALVLVDRPAWRAAPPEAVARPSQTLSR